MTAIMGPSGSGKTTLLRIIGGQIRPDHGEVIVGGENACELSRGELMESGHVWRFQINAHANR